MSITFQTNNTNRIQFTHGMWIHNFSGRFTNRWSNRLPAVIEEDDSTTSSSIGNNSDSGAGEDSGEDSDEVQSKENGMMNDLEKVLPIKRGISSFYAGKSKSYGSLSDAVSVPSIQDIVKPEDAYSRKRKNMIAHHVFMDKHCGSDNGISKRIARNSKTSVSRPPLPPNGKRVASNELPTSPWRSLSLSDLQHVSDASSGISVAVSSKRDKNGYDEYR